MAKVFTVKSNANRKVRATVEQYPGSCKAGDFTVEPVEGGFVIRMTDRDEPGQAFARYHDFEYAVPGIEPAAEAEQEMSADERLAHADEVIAHADATIAANEAALAEAASIASSPAEAPEGELVLPEGFRLGRAKPAPEIPDVVGYLNQGLDPDVAAAPKKARKARAAAAPAPAPKATHAGPGKFAAIREAAERGELPPVPDFSADLHKRNRGRLAQLVEMAERGDVAGLEAFPIKPNCTSPKAMDRYRNLCVIALKARAAKPTA